MSNLNIKNRTIFCRDNLDIMEGINDDCIDLIYLDPPFNKKKVFTAPIGSSSEGAEFSDIFREEDIKDNWVDTIKFENPQLYEYLKGVKSFSNTYNYCYLVYMSIRLIECHRILKDTGSLYLHCDPTMSHYLKIVLDCIFGEKGFRNEVVWCYKGASEMKKAFPKKHDVIFFYAKTDRILFNYDDIRIPYKEQKTTITKWSDGIHEKHPKGTKCLDWFTDIPSFMTASQSKERTGYPTQKPLALLHRIIKASSDKNDIVFDPFCGCATTCIAAEQLERKWIGIDISIKAYDLVKERLQKEVPSDLFRGEPNFSTKPPVRSKDERQVKGFVYVIKNDNWEGMYKVGIAKDINRRLNSYQASDPYRSYSVAYSFETPYYKEIEKHIHNKFPGDYEWVEGKLEDIKKAICEFTL